MEAAPEDIGIFESVAGHVLDALGYVRAVVPSGGEKEFSSEDVNNFDKENSRRKEEVRKLIDPGDLMRRDLQSGLLSAVRERLARRPALMVPLARLAPGIVRV